MPLEEALSDQDAVLIVQQAEGDTMNVKPHGNASVMIANDGHV